MPSQRTKASVVVRNATLDDVPNIAALVLKVYGRPADGYTPGMLRGQISAFPEGQFLVGEMLRRLAAPHVHRRGKTHNMYPCA